MPFIWKVRKLSSLQYYGIKEYGYPILESIKVNLDVEFKGLPDKQLPTVDAFNNAKDKFIGGGIISVPCGYGKTVLGLYSATLLKLKTP